MHFGDLRLCLERERMKKRALLLLALLLALTMLVVLILLTYRKSNSKANANFTNVSTIRAVRVDFLDQGKSRGEVSALEANMQKAGVNLVALGAGRVDWTYFAWKGHRGNWSADVKKSGNDYLLEDSFRFGKWAHVSAVVDVLSPLYIQAHPEAAAVSWTGTPSKDLVGTMEMVDGQFGQELLSMVDEIATNYPVNSVTITELVYYVDGFGEKDKVAYITHTGCSDWPRSQDGRINIDDPSIGQWRSYEISRLLEKMAVILHRNGKLLFLEVHFRLDSSGQVIFENGTDPALFLKYADRLVVIGDNNADMRISSITAITQYLKRFPQDRTIIGFGLWSKDYDPGTSKDQMSALPAENFRAAIHGTDGDLWITPSFLMTGAHWQVLEGNWGIKNANPQ
jgi:hypothetical protein